MPIFEFVCCDCCESFEKLVFKSDESVSCPKCNSTKVQRQMSSFGFKSGGEKGAASSRMGSGGASSCAGCTAGTCSTCH